MRRSSIWIALAAAVGLHLGCAPEREPRHVVLVSIDTLRAGSTGCYGYERDTTPNLDRVAAEGTLFENAYTPQVWTMTAHLSMVTGLYPKTHGAAKSRPASPAATTLAEILREEGFATAAFTGIGGWAGPDYGLGRGFDVFHVGSPNAGRENPIRLEWLEQQARLVEQDPEHRFFLLSHYYDVHSEFAGRPLPYQAPEPYILRYLPDGLDDWQHRGGTDLLKRLQESGDVSTEDRRILTALYDAGVRYTDEVGLGPLLGKLEELGLYDETLLIITSDHGEEIFEHGACCHRQPYEETARVPLVMAGPGIPSGRRVDGLVELVDLMPTILSQLGFAAPGHVQGRDLTPSLSSGVAGRVAYVDGLFGAIPPYKNHEASSLTAVIDGRRWSLVNKVYERAVDGERIFETRSPGELYLLDEDPGQRTDLWSEEQELAMRLERQLLAWYAENEAASHRLGHAEIQESVLSPSDREKLRALGYLD